MTFTGRDNDLRKKYTNIGAALPEIVVTSESSNGKYHRQDGHSDEPHAMCRDSGDWAAVESTQARVLCNGPCLFCFEAVLDEHAQRDDSPVEYRYPDVDDPKPRDWLSEEVVDLVEELELDRDDPCLTARPETVLNASGSKMYHAPTQDGPHCGTSGEFQEHPLDAVVGHYKPCTNCFDVDALPEPEPREPAVADG